LVAFNQRPVIRLEFEQSSGVRHHAWCMAAAERASATSDRIVLRPACQPKPHMNVAAVASAQMVHVDESRDWLSKCQRLPTPHGLAGCLLFVEVSVRADVRPGNTSMWHGSGNGARLVMRSAGDIAKRHPALFLLVYEVALDSRSEQEVGHATY
jgi:hypothetical protein